MIAKCYCKQNFLKVDNKHKVIIQLRSVYKQFVYFRLRLTFLKFTILRAYDSETNSLLKTEKNGLIFIL